jgi:acetolactate synthase-1/3 small subunit
VGHSPRASHTAPASHAPRIKKHAISLYVSNKPGVLNRVALVFARRGFNIDSLVVSEGQDPGFSHMNLVASGDEKTLVQIIKQLNKLVDVIHAKEHTGKDAIQRELALLKVKCPPPKRTELLDIAHAFGCRIMDLGEATLTLQATGSTEKIDSLRKMVDPYGILELVRSGKLLIARGEAIT